MTTQMKVKLDMMGTTVGVARPGVPMLATISLANDWFICNEPNFQGNYYATM